MTNSVDVCLADCLTARYLEALIDGDWDAIGAIADLVTALARRDRRPELAALAVSIRDDIRCAWPVP